MQDVILVVDDEIEIVTILKYNLEALGYSVLTAFDGQQALDITFERNPDLILLDAMLPVVDGFAVCRKIREKLDMPIMMITARDQEVDAVLGLELGADDYITKPFRMKELMARVKSNLRRAKAPQENKKISSNCIQIGNIIIDIERYEVLKDGKEIALTGIQFDLLKYLASRPGEIVSRETLLKEVWDYDYYGDLHTVDVTIRRLRVKIEDDPSNPKYIQTKRGIGFYFEKEHNLAGR